MEEIKPKLSELDMLLEDLSNTRNSFQERTSERVIEQQKKAVITEMKQSATTTTMPSTIDSSIDQSKWEYQGYGIWETSEEQQRQQVTVRAANKMTELTSSRMVTEVTTTTNGVNGNGVNNKNGSASNATEELDDLINSLNEYKLRDSILAKDDANKGDSAPSTLDDMLDNLQTDMTKQGVKTKQKGMCAACDKPIVGQVITALGLTWHTEHFLCAHCNTELGTQAYFERDGKPYCEADYHQMFSPKCPRCQEAILDKCVSAMDETFHPDCFVCERCESDFGDDGYHEMDEKAFCKKCFQDLFSITCGGCSLPIEDTCISFMDQHWHANCFVCDECKQPFKEGNYFVHNNKPYCETHYHALRGSLCAGCQKPITGRCITAMFRKFHPEHFVCSFCLKQLNKGTFKEKEEKPYCHNCFDRLFG